MHADRLLRDAYPAFPLDFVGIFALKSIGVSLGIFGDALAFTFANLARVPLHGTTAEIVLGALENPFHRAEGDLKIPPPVGAERQTAAHSVNGCAAGF